MEEKLTKCHNEKIIYTLGNFDFKQLLNVLVDFSHVLIFQ